MEVWGSEALSALSKKEHMSSLSALSQDAQTTPFGQGILFHQCMKPLKQPTLGSPPTWLGRGLFWLCIMLSSETCPAQFLLDSGPVQFQDGWVKSCIARQAGQAAVAGAFNAENWPLKLNLNLTVDSWLHFKYKVYQDLNATKIGQSSHVSSTDGLIISTPSPGYNVAKQSIHQLPIQPYEDSWVYHIPSPELSEANWLDHDHPQFIG